LSRDAASKVAGLRHLKGSLPARGIERAELVPRCFRALREEPSRRRHPVSCLRELAPVLVGLTVERERAIEGLPTDATRDGAAERVRPRGTGQRPR